MSQFPPPAEPVGYPGPQVPLKPHRGAVILTLGIVGLVICFICGIIAWVMGREDLRQMDMGQMDPSGRGLTQAGTICGMISVILVAVMLGVWLIGGVLMGMCAAGTATAL